jgi:uncharacterized protein YbjT (DUF2867 family)
MDRDGASVSASSEPRSGARPIAVLAGASGLVGASCAEALAKDGRFDVVAVVRRPLDHAPPGMRMATVDFATLATASTREVLSAAGATTVRDMASSSPLVAAGLCALGTTIKNAGSQAAFRAVDHDAVVGFATWARAAGATRFVVVSSVGADARSSTFYLRVKGETEAALAALGFSRLVVLRPSFLRGHRGERRLGETIAGALFPLLEPVMAGSFRRYRSIEASTVAQAMVSAAASEAPGHFVWEHDEIVRQAAMGAPVLAATVR